MLQGECISARGGGAHTAASRPPHVSRPRARAHAHAPTQDCCECCADIICASPLSSTPRCAAAGFSRSVNAHVTSQQAARARCAAERHHPRPDGPTRWGPRSVVSCHDVPDPEMGGAMCRPRLVCIISLNAFPVRVLPGCTPDPRMDMLLRLANVAVALSSSPPPPLFSPRTMTHVCSPVSSLVV